MIIGTAGHIDHGKTTLVRALTGVDTDRLKEEKARGISIELGYAYTPLANGEVLGFIDVPGHERLVHTMVAGACGIDFALLVVAADDGVMPQTREHVAILELLGVAQGAVALTKIDRVGRERLGEVDAQVKAMLGSTALKAAPLFALDATAAEHPGTTLEFIPTVGPFSDEHVALMAAMSEMSTGRSGRACGVPALRVVVSTPVASARRAPTVHRSGGRWANGSNRKWRIAFSLPIMRTSSSGTPSR